MHCSRALWLSAFWFCHCVPSPCRRWSIAGKSRWRMRAFSHLWAAKALRSWAHKLASQRRNVLARWWNRSQIAKGIRLICLWAPVQVETKGSELGNCSTALCLFVCPTTLKNQRFSSGTNRISGDRELSPIPLRKSYLNAEILMLFAIWFFVVKLSILIALSELEERSLEAVEVVIVQVNFEVSLLQKAIHHLVSA